MAAAGGGAGLRSASALVSMPLRKSLPSREPFGFSALPWPEARAGASVLGLAVDLVGAAAAALVFSGVGLALGAGFSGAGLGLAGAFATSFFAGAGFGAGAGLGGAGFATSLGGVGLGGAGTGSGCGSGSGAGAASSVGPFSGATLGGGGSVEIRGAVDLSATSSTRLTSIGGELSFRGLGVARKPADSSPNSRTCPAVATPRPIFSARSIWLAYGP